jgi:hypothetical protein
MGKERKIPQPALLPTVSAEEIIELLRVQKAKGEELMKNGSLSLGDLQYWNIFTKEILTKAFGPSRDYIDSILYAGENKPLSAYEPESSLAKMRRSNFQSTLRMLEECMERVLHPAPPGTEAAEEAPPSPKSPAKAGKLAAPAGLIKESVVPKVKNMEESKDRRILIVPGQSEEEKAGLEAFLENLDLEPFIPGKPADPGAGPFAVLEQYGEVPFAIVLLSGDDCGYAAGSPEKARPRPSQRVILELGFLMGRLKPEQVCALCEEGLDLPAGVNGTVLIPRDAGGLWKLLTARAMKMGGLDIDLNKAI